MKVPYKKRAKSTKKSLKAKVTKKPTVNMVKTIVRKAINRNAENKMRQNGGVKSIVPTTNVAYQTNCIIPLSPYYEAGLSAEQNLDIVQGTSVSSRIGNRIKTTSCRLRMVIFPLQYNVSTNPYPQPLDVTLWIFKLKSGLTDSTAQVLSQLTINWFKYGSSAIPISNSIGDVVNIVNPDFIQLLKRKVYKIGCAANTGTGGQAGFQYHANNDYKFNQVINMDVTKYVRKYIHYADNNAMPTTATTWMCLTCAYASGASMTNSTVPANFQWEYDYRYEDA